MNKDFELGRNYEENIECKTERNAALFCFF